MSRCVQTLDCVCVCVCIVRSYALIIEQTDREGPLWQICECFLTQRENLIPAERRRTDTAHLTPAHRPHLSSSVSGQRHTLTAFSYTHAHTLMPRIQLTLSNYVLKYSCWVSDSVTASWALPEGRLFVYLFIHSSFHATLPPLRLQTIEAQIRLAC